MSVGGVAVKKKSGGPSCRDRRSSSGLCVCARSSSSAARSPAARGGGARRDFFFSRRRRHTRWPRDWSSDVCSSDLASVSSSALWNARTSSGSSRSASDVKPERSAKRTVTCRRSASRLAGGGFSAAAVVPGPSATPQRGQNAKSVSHTNPHARQARGSRRPHRGQNAKPGEASAPQPVQVDIACTALLRSGALDAEGRQHGLDEALERVEVVGALAEGEIHALDADGLVGLAHLERVLRRAAEEALALRVLAPVRREDRLAALDAFGVGAQVEADIDGTLEGLWIAAFLGAPVVEDRVLGLPRLRVDVGRVPAVGVFRRRAERPLLALSADPDGQAFLDGLGIAARVVELEVLALEVRDRLVEERP